ncbi:uncharacterized protein (DUF1810 family) [Altererythrobacter atlanticus]|nr:uncharacterized protein (DUF1810 family) [Croceibacterium atlanticum]
MTRFLQAQAGIYPRALEELRQGSKTSHWMWFVFPQIEGLGRSSTAQFYAIADLAEARAYCGHELLGERLAEATRAMLDWAGRKSARDILGETDAIKFRSSMTLFEAACADRDLCAAALDAFYDGERDPATLEKIGATGRTEPA